MTKKINSKKQKSGVVQIYKILFGIFLLMILPCITLCAEDMYVQKGIDDRNAFIAEAKTHIGKPYKYGATGPQSFDCSGFIYYCARESLSLQMPRTSKAMYNYCKIISDDEKQPGDLVFFTTRNSTEISHVGIYLGKNEFISAVSSGSRTGIQITNLNENYWKDTYVATGRFLNSTVKFFEESQENEFSQNSKNSQNSSEENKNSFTDSNSDWLTFDFSGFFDYSFIEKQKVGFLVKGGEISSEARLSKIPLMPELGIAIRYDHPDGRIQFPITIGINFNDFFGFFGGVIFSTNSSFLKTYDDSITHTKFPAILGFSFNLMLSKSPEFSVNLIQKISYTFYKSTNEKNLSLYSAIFHGFNFQTGICISLPLSTF